MQLETRLPKGLKLADFGRAVVCDRHPQEAAAIVAELLGRVDRGAIPTALGRWAVDDFARKRAMTYQPELGAALINDLLAMTK